VTYANKEVSTESNSYTPAVTETPRKYENVLAEVNKFKSMYNQNVYVHITKRNGVTVYRLLLGNFINKLNADQLEAQIKNQGLDCFVSDLSKI